MLAANNIGVRRRSRTLLAGVDLAVAPGELVALIGPNGAGKSTLLHALSGASACDSGSVHVDDRPLAHHTHAELARRRAVLPQAAELSFSLSVREVVALGRSPHAGYTSRTENERIITDALAQTDVAHLAMRAYPTLSGGERQRVQLARVLAQVGSAADAGATARYLLLDEPTNNLDIAHQHRLIDTAWRFSRHGNGVLAVLHDPNLAASRADRIVVLVAGEVAATGPPIDVLNESVLLDAFGVRAHVRHHPDTGRPYMLPA
ncbi:heme ABC transporter ATP-binding protein [Salinisphaera orenii]|uniref:heme ABC transporter ATP-binding protein n=1 Tax=Salinisphaera orenii TaxID=856731 RepID=UPI000DBEAA0B